MLIFYRLFSSCSDPISAANADTVEDRILALQEKKQRMADSALGEGEAGNISTRLSMAELTSLFDVAK